MASEPFFIEPFSPDALYRALSNPRCTPLEVLGNNRAQYLAAYLTAIDAKSIVVENDYTDGDYLEDFATYYVRCFVSYERRCKRIHFFSQVFTRDQLQEIFLASNTDPRIIELQDAYLGFVVARPLPNAVVGRTIIKTYPSDNGRRNYRAIRSYRASLFGVPLLVDSLPFQEQDSVLAACATVALWSAFHKASELFGTASPRPALITRVANGVVNPSRPIPSHGLSIEQMCLAIRDVELEPELIPATAATPIPSLIYGHLRAGLPAILVVEIQGQGLHAVTLTGYSLLKQKHLAQEVGANEQCIPMKGLRINEFYCHDDQIGPFAKIEVKAAAGNNPVTFEGSWKDLKTGTTLSLTPVCLVVPIYNKVRVTFLDVQQWLTRFNAIARVFLQPDLLEWDLHLVTNNGYKNELKDRSIPAADRERILLNQQPRFLWRGLLRSGNTELVEILVDATDMQRSFPICDIVWHHDAFRAQIDLLLKSPNLKAILSKTLTTRFLDFLTQSTGP